MLRRPPSSTRSYTLFPNPPLFRSLQERLATSTTATATYAFDATGPDHARHFTVTVTADGHELGVGTGRSKKQAEQQAARSALELLDDGAGLAGATDAQDRKSTRLNSSH